MENSKFETRWAISQVISKMKKSKRLKCIICSVVILITAIVMTSHCWLPLIARFLIINNTLQVSDVIIVPSGNSQNLRVELAVDIYKKKYAPKILFCGELALQKETGINLARIYASSLGVCQTNILTEENSKSTFENALFSKKIIQENGYKSVIIVTYPTHTRRTKKIFKEIFPEDVKITIYCNKNDFDVNNWWKDRNRAREVVYEYFAFIWHTLFGT